MNVISANCSLRLFPMAGFVVSSLAVSAAAQTTFEWNDPSGGVFQDSTNWMPAGGPPSGLDTARFAQDSAYTVSFNADRTHQFLIVDQDDVTFDLNGHTYALTGDYPTVIFANAPDVFAQVTVLDGTWTSNWTSLASFWPTSQASLTLPGAVTWQNSGAIYIGSAGAASVEASGGADVTCLWTSIGGANSVLDLLGAGTTWTCNGSVMEVGDSGTGSLNVTTGAHVSSSWGGLGTLPGSHGTASISGAGSRWDMPGGVTVVGNEGIGDLLIQNGGVVTTGFADIGSQTTGDGMVSVSGAGSLWDVDTIIHVGLNGSGTLNVGNGASVAAGFMIVGRFPGSYGEMTVDGELNINADQSYLFVGFDGPGQATINGTLTVVDPGGVVGNPDGFVNVGLGPGAPAMLTINGTCDSTAQLQLASFEGGQGTVLINPGGVAISRKASSPSGSAGIVGRNGIGDMTIDGGLWNCLDGALNVGFSVGSHGSMTIENGGQAQSIGGFVGRNADSDGHVIITGSSGGGVQSSWTSTAPITVGDVGIGSLSVFNGGQAEAPAIAIGPNGAVGGNGTLLGNVTNNGSLLPGDVPGPLDVGTLSIDGAYTQGAEATLVIDVAGAAPGQFDRVEASGVINLAGTLHVNLAAGFQPAGGEQIVIMANGFVLNSFDEVVSPVRVGVTPQETSVLLTFCGLADIDCDTHVDADDWSLFFDCLTGPNGGPLDAACGPADLDEDNDVDLDDVAVFANAFSG